MGLRLRSNEASRTFPRKPAGRRLFCRLPALAQSLQPAAGMLHGQSGTDPRSLGTRQNPSPQDPSQFPDWLLACLKIRSGGRPDCRRGSHPVHPPQYSCYGGRASRNWRGSERNVSKYSMIAGHQRCFRRAGRLGSTAGETPATTWFGRQTEFSERHLANNGDETADELRKRRWDGIGLVTIMSRLHPHLVTVFRNVFLIIYLRSSV